MVTSNCCHFRQNPSPSPDVLLCLTLTSFDEDSPEFSGLLLHISWIHLVENGHHRLTKLFPASNNFHQFVQAPCRRSIVLREQDDRDSWSTDSFYKFRTDRFAPVDVIINECVDSFSFEFLQNVTEKGFPNICSVEAWENIVYPVAVRRRRRKSHENEKKGLEISSLLRSNLQKKICS